MTIKFPPPPFLAGAQQQGAPGGTQSPGSSSLELQRLNRWLIEIQNILNAGGFIDPTQIAGLPAVITEVGQNTANITTLFADVLQNSNDIVSLFGQVAALQGSVTTLQGLVTALQARNQVLNANGAPASLVGNNGDLYINNTGAAGSFLYGKIAGAWVAFA